MTGRCGHNRKRPCPSIRPHMGTILCCHVSLLLPWCTKPRWTTREPIPDGKLIYYSPFHSDIPPVRSSTVLEHALIVAHQSARTRTTVPAFHSSPTTASAFHKYNAKPCASPGYVARGWRVPCHALAPSYSRFIRSRSYQHTHTAFSVTPSHTRHRRTPPLIPQFFLIPPTNPHSMSRSSYPHTASLTTHSITAVLHRKIHLILHTPRISQSGKPQPDTVNPRPTGKFEIQI